MTAFLADLAISPVTGLGKQVHTPTRDVGETIADPLSASE
jgi:hypothetical protein